MDHDLMFRYLTGKASAEERKKFEEWLSVSESNKDMFEEWAQIWKASRQAYTNFQPDTNKRWAEFSTNIPEKRNVFFLNNFYRVAAAILIFLMLGTGGIYYWYRSGMTSNEKFIVYTSVNDTLNVVLKDGTMVTLNTLSTLRIPKSFSFRNRLVYVDGEAFFNVTHDTSHPFKVFSGKTLTEVLGTSFNILNNESEVQVSLITGKVSFTALTESRKSIILLPGQHGIFNGETNNLSKDTLTGMNVIAWKTKRLEFIEVSMDELCAALAGLYHKNFEVSNACRDDKYTGIIDDLSLEEALDIIHLTMDFKIEESEGTIRFVPLNMPQQNKE